MAWTAQDDTGGDADFSGQQQPPRPPGPAAATAALSALLVASLFAAVVYIRYRTRAQSELLARLRRRRQYLLATIGVVSTVGAALAAVWLGRAPGPGPQPSSDLGAAVRDPAASASLPSVPPPSSSSLVPARLLSSLASRLPPLPPPLQPAAPSSLPPYSLLSWPARETILFYQAMGTIAAYFLYFKYLHAGT